MMDVQIYPLTTVTCQIGETAVEERNYPEVFIIRRSCGHLVDYNLEQIKLGIMLANVRFRVFWVAVPKQCSVNPAVATIDEHHPRRVHANPVHTINVVEGDGDRIAVKGVDARHPTIVMLRDMPFLKIRRHHQARSCLKKLWPEGFE